MNLQQTWMNFYTFPHKLLQVVLLQVAFKSHWSLIRHVILSVLINKWVIFVQEYLKPYILLEPCKIFVGHIKYTSHFYPPLIYSNGVNVKVILRCFWVKWYGYIVQASVARGTALCITAWPRTWSHHSAQWRWPYVERTSDCNNWGHSAEMPQC